jgi:hypothetical protein
LGPRLHPILTPYTIFHLVTPHPRPYTIHPEPYRGTSLIRKRTPLGPYRRPMPRVLGAQGGWAFFYGSGHTLPSTLNRDPPLTVGLTHSLTHSHSLSFTLTHSHSRSLTHSHSHSHSHSYSLAHSHSLTRTHSLSPTHSLTLAHALTLTHSLTHSLSRTHSH